MPIGVHLIFGKQPEPFLGPALESVSWADYVCAVNTAPDEGPGQANEVTVHQTVPREKLRLDRIRLNPFSFSEARNRCLALADDGDHVLILDADDVHYPEWEQIARELTESGHDMITAHFWHLAVYKDLWHSEPHREILFTKENGVGFAKNVHEALEHPRRNPALAGTYHYCHYGYVKPPREVFRRWKLYSELEGDPNHYDGQNPDDILVGYVDVCQPFWRDHPPAVQEVLEDYPSAPASARAIEAPSNVGLVMLTWNDAENLETCLKSLATTRQPFKLCVVDNGSSDGSVRLVSEFEKESGIPTEQVHVLESTGPNSGKLAHGGPGVPLATALNIGFSYFMNEPGIDYIGWIHPDMVFERDTWLECLRHALDTHPDIVKAGAWEMDTARGDEPWAGNSQCYLIRKSALERVGLFDETYEACGGYEDWDHNKRLLQVGRVMIWPDAAVRHNAMGTRKNHNNEEAARRNADRYHAKWGTWNAPV